MNSKWASEIICGMFDSQKAIRKCLMSLDGNKGHCFPQVSEPGVLGCFYIPEMAFLRSIFDHAQSLPPSLPLQCVELVQIFPICQCGDDVILGLDTTNSCVDVSEVCEGSVISQEIFCRGYSLKK